MSDKFKLIKSLKWNASANFIGLGYTVIIGIVILPLYLQYLGAEAFGLVGFFTALQAWLQLLDMGMSPLLSRQTAHTRGQDYAFLELKRLLRSLELIFFILALIVVFIFYSGSAWIARNWLNVTSLALDDVATCIVLMGLMIGLRFSATLYRSGIQGMEDQVILNIANMILATLRFAGALLLLRFVTLNFVYFFVYQFFISIIELVVLAFIYYRLIPSTDKVGIRFFWNTLKPMLPFASGMAYATVIWVSLTQLDKIILSNVLPLSEYGYFALVVVVSTGISQISGPISQAILPRLTYLLSQGKEQEMLVLYRQATQFMTVIMMPLSGVIALFATELLFAWTGDRKAAEWAGPILFWFALGNGVLAINAFQYYLQFAHGKLGMHIIYNSVLLIFQIPLIIYAAYKYGALGVALVWFAFRLITFIIWIPIVHKQFAPGIHRPWLLKDVLPPSILTAILLVFINSFSIDFSSMSRLGIFTFLFGVGLLMLTANTLFSRESRKLIINMIHGIALK